MKEKNFKKASKKNIVIGALVFTLVLTAGATSVYAFAGDMGGKFNEDREKMKEAVENNDYNAWKNIMTERINEEHFSEMVEMHKNKGEMMEKKEQAREAVKNGDYNAWLEIVGEDSKMAEKINADNFSKLTEMHNLRQEGKHDEAKEIREELGLEKGLRDGKMGPGHEGMRGFGQKKGF